MSSATGSKMLCWLFCWLVQENWKSDSFC